jgi:hypothetical protein
MNGSTLLHRQIFGFLSQYSKYKDRRHLQALAWMVTGLIGSGELSMAAWEPYVVSRATQAQSYERRWRRLVKNPHINVQRMADRAFPCHGLMGWLSSGNWHYALRLKCDVSLHGIHCSPIAVARLFPPLNQAKLLTNVGLWSDATYRTNLVVATVAGAKDSWAVITNETPTLQTLWQYGLRFCVEELFLDSKSGAFQLEDSRLRSTAALERLYLVAATALLYATTTGITLQISGLRTTVDPHWRRGLSYLNIGLRYLRGAIVKGRQFLAPSPLLARAPDPCFASHQAQLDYYDSIWFSRISSLVCHS